VLELGKIAAVVELDQETGKPPENRLAKGRSRKAQSDEIARPR
jgi:hypothetical protein